MLYAGADQLATMKTSFVCFLFGSLSLVPPSFAFRTLRPSLHRFPNVTTFPRPLSPVITSLSPNTLEIQVPGTKAALRFSDFHERLNANALRSLLIEELHDILLDVLKRARGDLPIGGDYSASCEYVHIHVNNHAEGHGLTYGQVGNVLAGIGILADTLEPRDSMIEYLEDGEEITYGYIGV